MQQMVFIAGSYCLLNMFRAPLCPSSGAREYYTGGCCLWYLLLWFSNCRYGVQLRVMCLVCIHNNSLHYLTLIKLTVARFVGTGDLSVRYSNGHTKKKTYRQFKGSHDYF